MDTFDPGQVASAKLGPVSWAKDGAKRVIAPLARIATRRYARVLMYHRFGPGDPERRLDPMDLDRQLTFLRRHFTILSLGDLVSDLRSGAPLKDGVVALTIDDAYADFGEHAYPVFRRHGVPVTVYVVSEFASGGFWLWWDAIRHLLDRAENGNYRAEVSPGRWEELTLGNKQSRFSAWLKLAKFGTGVSPSDREQFMRRLPEALGVSLPVDPPRESAAMTWSELRAMDPDIVEIGAHTRTHPILSLCDTATIDEEVMGSKKEIESRIGRQVRAFCYPNGESADVDDRCREAVRKAGFDSAVMACGGMVKRGSNLYALERMSAPNRFHDFRSDVSGIAYLRQVVANRE